MSRSGTGSGTVTGIGTGTGVVAAAAGGLMVASKGAGLSVSKSCRARGLHWVVFLCNATPIRHAMCIGGAQVGSDMGDMGTVQRRGRMIV